ncbi:hypothetical protein ACFLYF_00185 [Chloroflexota bacterium]
MPWRNLGTLLAVLRRRGIDPRDVTVYWDGQVDAGFRRPPPPYSEPVTEPEDDDPYYDDGEY